MGEKIYVIDDHVAVKEQYLNMTKEERRKEIARIVQEDKEKKLRMEKS